MPPESPKARPYVTAPGSPQRPRGDSDGSDGGMSRSQSALHLAGKIREQNPGASYSQQRSYADFSSKFDELPSIRAHRERAAALEKLEGERREKYNEKYKQPWWIGRLRHVVAFLSDRALSTFVFLIGIMELANVDLFSLITANAPIAITIFIALPVFTILQQWYVKVKHERLRSDHIKAELDTISNLMYINDMKKELGLDVEKDIDYQEVLKQRFEAKSKDVTQDRKNKEEKRSFWKFGWMSKYKRTGSVTLRAFLLIMLALTLLPSIVTSASVFIPIYFTFCMGYGFAMYTASVTLFKNKQMKYDAIDGAKALREETEKERKDLELKVLKQRHLTPRDPAVTVARSPQAETQISEYTDIINSANGAAKPRTNIHRVLSFLTIMLTTGIGSVFVKSLSVGLGPYDVNMFPVFIIMATVAGLMALMELGKSLIDIEKLEEKTAALDSDLGIYKSNALPNGFDREAYNELLQQSPTMAIMVTNDACVRDELTYHLSVSQLLNKCFKKAVYKTIKAATLVILAVALDIIPTFGAEIWVMPVAVCASVFLISLAEYLVKTYNICKQKTRERHLKVAEFDDELAKIAATPRPAFNEAKNHEADNSPPSQKDSANVDDGNKEALEEKDPPNNLSTEKPAGAIVGVLFTPSREAGQGLLSSFSPGNVVEQPTPPRGGKDDNEDVVSDHVGNVFLTNPASRKSANFRMSAARKAPAPLSLPQPANQ